MTKEKILYFEGAGCNFWDDDKIPSDIGNYRIRTVFKNNNGHLIYFEAMNGAIKTSLCVDALFDITVSPDQNESNLLRDYNIRDISKKYSYTKKDITNFINEFFKMNFTTIEVLDEFENYRVFGKNHNEYNVMDYHILNPKRTKLRREAYNFMYNQGLALREYPCILTKDISDDTIVFRYPNTDNELKKASLKREYTFKTIDKLELIKAV